MPTQLYDVPVVQADLRQEESLMQLFDSLEHLDLVVCDVFNRISSSVGESQSRLVAVNNRVNVARARVKRIAEQQRTRATQVFSSAKYPAPEAVDSQHTLYTQSSSGVAQQEQEGPWQPHKYEVRTSRVDENVMREKLQFFNVDLKARRKREGEITADEEQHEGLGGLPSNLPSVSSLLLFNTGENPYKKYVTIDPLHGAITKTRDDIEEKRDLHDAPSTILSGEQYQMEQGENFRYVPGMGSVPEISVPSALPDLAGVADLAFDVDLAANSIAPSIGLPDMPDLPDLAPVPSAVQPSAAPAAAAATETATAPPAAAAAAAAAPPGPPPPPAPAATLAAAPPGPPPPPPAPAATSAPPPPPPPAPAAGGPPAPAPPPPPPAGAPPPPAPPAAAAAAPPPPADDGGRGGLLSAIRRSSHAQLKSSKDRKMAKKESKAAAPSGGGGLMGDLSARLKMRRKGISGANDGKKTTKEDDDMRPPRESKSLGGGSMLDSLAAMIPSNDGDGGGEGGESGSDGEWDD